MSSIDLVNGMRSSHARGRWFDPSRAHVGVPSLGRSQPGYWVAMSQENVELLRTVYEQWERGNLSAGKDLFDPEIESVWPPEFPSGGTYRGVTGHTRAMREWLSPWKDFRLVAEGFYEAASSVVVPFRVHARGGESGVEVERRWAHIWTLRGGKVVRFEVSLDPARALEAVGLSE